MLLHKPTGIVFPDRKTAVTIMSKYNYIKAIKSGDIKWINSNKREILDNYIKKVEDTDRMETKKYNEDHPDKQKIELL